MYSSEKKYVLSQVSEIIGFSLPIGGKGGALGNIYLSAERIWVHHLFQACRGSLFTLRLVLFRNCFREPEDMYSVMKMTWKNEYRLHRSSISHLSIKI